MQQQCAPEPLFPKITPLTETTIQSKVKESKHKTKLKSSSSRLEIQNNGGFHRSNMWNVFEKQRLPRPCFPPAIPSLLPHNGISGAGLGKFDTYNSIDTRGHIQACAWRQNVNVCFAAHIAPGGTWRACESLTRSAHSAQRGAKWERHSEGTSCFICCKEAVLQLNYLSWFKTTADTRYSIAYRLWYLIVGQRTCKSARHSGLFLTAGVQGFQREGERHRYWMRGGGERETESIFHTVLYSK